MNTEREQSRRVLSTMELFRRAEKTATEEALTKALGDLSPLEVRRGARRLIDDGYIKEHCSEQPMIGVLTTFTLTTAGHEAALRFVA